MPRRRLLLGSGRGRWTTSRSVRTTTIPYDDDEVARLAALGYTPETDPGVIVDGSHVELCFQKVDLARRSKTPVHLDLAPSEWLAEIDRLTRRGATVRQRFERHAWMRDPEGNDFCIVAADE